MACVLFYNLNNHKGNQIRLICRNLHLQIHDVCPDEYDLPIGQLAGIKPAPARRITVPPTQQTKAVIPDEMLVFAGFTEELLDAFLVELRASHSIGVSLKAVLTPTNAQWSSITLHAALSREHAQFTRVKTSQNAEEKRGNA